MKFNSVRVTVLFGDGMAKVEAGNNVVDVTLPWPYSNDQNDPDVILVTLDAIRKLGDALADPAGKEIELAVSGKRIVRDQSAFIDLNSATEQQLDSLTGVGPELARRIIAARPFTSVDDLKKVSGISDKLLETNRLLLTVLKP